MHRSKAGWLLVIALAMASPALAAPGICRDLERGAIADFRAAWANRFFNRDGQGRVVLPAFDQAAKLMRAHRWQGALIVLERIERHPTPDAERAGLDEAAAGLTLLIRRCSRDWLTPNDPDSDDWNPKFHRAAFGSAYSIRPKLIFITEKRR